MRPPSHFKRLLFLVGGGGEKRLPADVSPILILTLFERGRTTKASSSSPPPPPPKEKRRRRGVAIWSLPSWDGEGERKNFFAEGKWFHPFSTSLSSIALAIVRGRCIGGQRRRRRYEKDPSADLEFRDHCSIFFWDRPPRHRIWKRRKGGGDPVSQTPHTTLGHKKQNFRKSKGEPRVTLNRKKIVEWHQDFSD